MPPIQTTHKKQKGQDETKTNKRQTRHLLLCIFAKLLHFDRPTLWLLYPYLPGKGNQCVVRCHAYGSVNLELECS